MAELVMLPLLQACRMKDFLAALPYMLLVAKVQIICPEANLLGLASHVLKITSWESAKSKGPCLQRFLIQMKFLPRACFNGTCDDCIFFLLRRTDVETFFAYKQISFIYTAISQKVCK